MTHREIIYGLLFGLCCAYNIHANAADLKLNWQRANANQSTSAPNINCNRGEGSINCGHGGGSDPDKTPFLQEIVRGTDNRNYYHVIVGDPKSGGFAQEVYIQASGASWQGGTGSASGGVAFSAVNQYSLAAAALSGNATGNPTQVLMQQIVSDGEMLQKFVKDEFQFKPLITNIINTAEMRSEFQADMRNLALSEMNTAAQVTNLLTFTDQDTGEFDSAIDATGSHVSAGQYRWIPGTGPGQSGGTWEYKDEDILDPALVDWIFFRHADENPPS